MNAAAAALVVLNGRQAFDPRASLFAHNEPGFWYDPSDLGTLYQDSAGTTPVTAVEQAVGLILDKSKGLVLEGDLVTNGTFNTDTTGWTAVNTPTLSVGANGVTIQNNGATSGILYQALTCVSGRTYQVSVKITYGGAGFARCEPSSGIPAAVGGSFINVTASGTYSLVFVATATTMYIVIGNRNDTNASHTYDNISVRELAGNHAIQPGATNRPILRSRYNQLLYSEDFSNAAWAKAGASTVTGTNTLNFPNTNEAISQSRTMYAVPGVSATFSVVLSGTGTITIGIARQAGGTYEQTISQITLTATPTRYSVARALVNSGHDGFVGFITRAAASGDTATTVTATQADLRFTNDTYLPYQRIAAATDYDTVGFPVYLAFDGSDDSLYTGGNVDFSATDKVTLWAGVTKLSDAAAAPIIELGPDSGANNGVFAIFAPSGGGVADYYWRSKGTVASNNSVTGNASPSTRVLTAIGDIAADFANLRVDGVDNTKSDDQGTGNFASAVVNIGRRNNASAPFNGRLYQLIGRGAATSAALITQAERWVAGKQGRAL